MKVPILFIAIEPCTDSNYENTFIALRKIYPEDIDFQVYVNSETKYFIIAGTEEEKLKIIVERLINEFNIELNASKTQVVYKQTIKNFVKSEGKYIRQCDICQYGHCKISIEPKERGKGYEFVNKIYDDKVIPKEYIKFVDYGIKESMGLGKLCAYSLTDIKVTLYDGSYNEIDSRERSYKFASFLAMKEAMKEAEIIFIEPILKLRFKLENISQDIISLFENRTGQIDYEVEKNEIVINIPLRETINDAPKELKTFIKHALLVDISHYKDVSDNVHKDIINEINFQGCYYENFGPLWSSSGVY